MHRDGSRIRQLLCANGTATVFTHLHVQCGLAFNAHPNFSAEISDRQGKTHTHKQRTPQVLMLKIWAKSAQKREKNWRFGLWCTKKREKLEIWPQRPRYFAAPPPPCTTASVAGGGASVGEEISAGGGTSLGSVTLVLTWLMGEGGKLNQRSSQT